MGRASEDGAAPKRNIPLRRVEGDRSVVYVVPDNATVDVLFIALNTFWTGSRTLDPVVCPMF